MHRILQTYQSVVIDETTAKECSLICGVPQGSALGPILFRLCTRKLSKPIAHQNIDHRSDADDTQLSNSFLPSDATVELIWMESCAKPVKTWMTENKLKLNDIKNEAKLTGAKIKPKEIWFGLVLI